MSLKKQKQNKAVRKAPKILVFDIETAPILAHVWKIWDENIGINQIKQDWHVLSWAAKWFGDAEGKVIYRDQRNSKKIEDDKEILKELWELINEADVLVTQNGNSFDIKKLNARFLANELPPPSPCKQVDTFLIAKKKFGFTSNKLEFMTNHFCKKYKKLKHKKFPGFEMWTECLAGNQEAWKEMEKYNKHDVLSLEELYTRLMAWDNSINFNTYNEDGDERVVCSCGCDTFEKRGFHYTQTGKYQRYRCQKCGTWTRGRANLFPKEQRELLRMNLR